MKKLYSSIYDETFRDAWGYTKKDFSMWISQKKGDGYDPSLWFIVWKDSKPVGFLMSRMQEDGLFIDLLGVSVNIENMESGRRCCFIHLKSLTNVTKKRFFCM
jgi:hypothetical protein